MRLVADQRPDEALEQFRTAIEKVKPKGVKVEFKFLHGAGPSLVDPDNEFIHRCAKAMQEVFGNETVYIRSGGSIPIVGVFQAGAGHPERHGGLRPARRQPARSQREALSARTFTGGSTRWRSTSVPGPSDPGGVRDEIS